MQTKQSNGNGRSCSPIEVAWRLFQGTGQIGLYLLYKELLNAQEENWRPEVPGATVAPRAAES